MKKWLCFFVSLLMVFSITSFAMAQANEEMLVVYAAVPEDWQAPCVWAWADDGQNAFAAWPGGEMDADPANPGWYYCYIPANTVNVIVNANGGTVQTKDYKLEGNSWLTILDGETVTVDTSAKTEGKAPNYTAKFTIYASVDEAWTAPCLWAWSAPDGTNAFAAWPGKAMQDMGDGWFSAKAPEWVNSIIVNGTDGTLQTADIEIDPVDVWLTIAADGTYELTYDDPNAKIAEDINVYVKAPAAWEAPCLWAWSAPDGTNAFIAWPGEPLVAGEDEWLTLTVPGWVNSIIVNGNAGTIQTTDISVEVGKDVYLTVTGEADAYELSYEKP